MAKIDTQNYCADYELIGQYARVLLPLKDGMLAILPLDSCWRYLLL